MKGLFWNACRSLREGLEHAAKRHSEHMRLGGPALPGGVPLPPRKMILEGILGSFLEVLVKPPIVCIENPFSEALPPGACSLGQCPRTKHI